MKIGLICLVAAYMLSQFYRAFLAVLAPALEADLARIRAEGVSYDREEHEPGIICIAVPILSSKGRVLGALSITSSTARASLDGLGRHRIALQSTAADIAQAAETWQFPT